MGETVSIVVETDEGSVKRLMERNGRPLTAEEAQAEDARVQALSMIRRKLAKQKKDGAAG